MRQPEELPRALLNEISASSREYVSWTDLLQVNVVGGIQVLNTEDMETASGVGDTDVYFAVDPAELT